MLAFIKHKKFWLPLVFLLLFFALTEFLLRFGWYDKYVKPNSYLGNVFYRLDAIEKLGLEKINWITVGDSRIDWGIDHKKFSKSRKEKNLTHVRMSFGSSNFVGTQTAIDWSMANMPSLKGVMLGLSENAFAQYSHIDNQYKVIWPMRKFMDLDNYQPLDDYQSIFAIFTQLAWSTYFQDIKDFLKNPVIRLKQIEKQQSKSSPLIYRKKSKHNLCAHPLETLQDCVDSTKNINFRKRELVGFRLLNSLCSTGNAKNRAKKNLPMPAENEIDRLVSNWTKLVENVINEDKVFVLVLLPEHESHNYIIKPSNAQQITQQILDRLSSLPNFKLIDLRQVFNDKPSCEMFADPTHFSQAGIDTITHAVIKAMNKYKL